MARSEDRPSGVASQPGKVERASQRRWQAITNGMLTLSGVCCALRNEGTSNERY